jgi:hypothetical protein
MIDIEKLEGLAQKQNLTSWITDSEYIESVAPHKIMQLCTDIRWLRCCANCKSMLTHWENETSAGYICTNALSEVGGIDCLTEKCNMWEALP